MISRKAKLGQPQQNVRNAGNMGRDLPNIFRSAAADDVDGIDTALRGGVDVNSVDADLMTPLHYAAANLAFRAADRLLLELNSKSPLDPTLADRFGRSASSVALEVWGALGVEMSRKLRPFCYPSNE